MQIAIVTPVSTESSATLARCLRSVERQSHRVALHVLVFDGPGPALRRHGTHVRVVHLPNRSGGGGTPRAIGSIYAISRGCDALAFLDADNTWTEDHVASAVNVARAGAELVISDRWICHHSTRRRMYRDTLENGHSVVDTNTLSLFGPAIVAGSWWWQGQGHAGMMPAGGEDRHLWAAITQHPAARNWRIRRTGQATVDYVSRWLSHYHGTSFVPPERAKILARHKESYSVLYVQPREQLPDGRWRYELARRQ